MKKFMLGLDTAKLGEIRPRSERNDLWAVRHVTTNPTLLRQAGKVGWDDYKELTAEITKLPNIEHVSVEISGYHTTGFSWRIYEEEARMVEGWKIHSAHKILIKVPATHEGFEMLQRNPNIARRTNVTLVFNEFQALRAAELGVFCISPFLGRLDDEAYYKEGKLNGLGLMRQLRELWDRWNITDTKILAASIRDIAHVKMSLQCGAEMLTLPPKIYDEYIKEVDEGLNNDALLVKGVERFRKDWAGE